MKVSTASSTSYDWLNLPEKSRPAKTKTFLIHSCGRPVLIAARSGERRGTTGSAEASRGTVGCSEVIVSMDVLRQGSVGRWRGAGVSCRALDVSPGGIVSLVDWWGEKQDAAPARTPPPSTYGSIKTPGFKTAAGSSSALAARRA